MICIKLTNKDRIPNPQDLGFDYRVTFDSD